eukprot:TRINITY_DN3470_c0_g2_i8.p1 TRINITY_DN3470_c0_g2~~TRINITY_DN3470_c0_g2_i8.p1  ORF type:complete len:299 (+),score=8.76 TRINITY_DN3470_c0_g2_i8:228-1124(+)
MENNNTNPPSAIYIEMPTIPDNKKALNPGAEGGARIDMSRGNEATPEQQVVPPPQLHNASNDNPGADDFINGLIADLDGMTQGVKESETKKIEKSTSDKIQDAIAWASAAFSSIYVLVSNIIDNSAAIHIWAEGQFDVHELDAGAECGGNHSVRVPAGPICLPKTPRKKHQRVRESHQNRWQNQLHHWNVLWYIKKEDNFVCGCAYKYLSLAKTVTAGRVRNGVRIRLEGVVDATADICGLRVFADRELPYQVCRMDYSFHKNLLIPIITSYCCFHSSLLIHTGFWDCLLYTSDAADE